jgi:tetratricopeptide (TPR) repeat protein
MVRRDWMRRKHASLSINPYDGKECRTMHATATCRIVLLIAALAGSAAGCRSTTSQSGVADRSWRDLFRPNARDLAAKRAREADAIEVPKDIGDSTELSLTYARWMEDVKNLPEARRHYSEVAERKPKNIEAVLGLARIDLVSGMNYEAEQGFLRALRLDPNSPVALHALGQFYASQQRWPEAVEVLNKAMLAAPAERQYRYDLAVALVRVGDINGAMPHFIRTVGDAEAHYNVGLILHQAGRQADAEQQLLLAVTKKPDLREAQVWLDEIRRARESSVTTAQAPAQYAPASQTGVQPVGLQISPAAASGPVMPASGAPSLRGSVSQPAPQQYSAPQQEQWSHQQPYAR